MTRPSKKRPGKRPSKHRGNRSDNISARRSSDGRGWVLVHPRAVRDRAEDLEEVRAMIGEEELEVAVDELRWLLNGCSEFIEAHQLLGELALAADNDVPLARGHFGTAYQLGIQALRRAGRGTRRGTSRSEAKLLPYAHLANRSLFEAGRGLMTCLHRLEKPTMAQEVVDQLIALDPTDPLGIQARHEELAGER